jgi:hypothetical protein
LRKQKISNKITLKSLIQNSDPDLVAIESEVLDSIKKDIANPFLLEVLNTLEIKSKEAVLSLEIEFFKSIIREVVKFRKDLKIWILACNELRQDNPQAKYSFLSFLESFHTTDLVAMSQLSFFRKLSKNKNKELSYTEITTLIYYIDEFLVLVSDELYKNYKTTNHLYKLTDKYAIDLFKRKPNILDERYLTIELKTFLLNDTDITLNSEEVDSIFHLASMSRQTKINFATEQGFIILKESLKRKLILNSEKLAWSITIGIWIIFNFDLGKNEQMFLLVVELLIFSLLSADYGHLAQAYVTQRQDFVRKSILMMIVKQAEKTPERLPHFDRFKANIGLEDLKSKLSISNNI